MIHKMRLNNEPFNNIKNGTKTIEMRLNDEKRKLLNIGDTIVFENRATNEEMETEIINLHYYQKFKDLYKKFNKVSLGYKDEEEAKPEDMEIYYKKEEQAKYGVVGIEIKVRTKSESGL